MERRLPQHLALKSAWGAGGHGNLVDVHLVAPVAFRKSFVHRIFFPGGLPVGQARFQALRIQRCEAYVLVGKSSN